MYLFSLTKVSILRSLSKPNCSILPFIVITPYGIQSDELSS